MHGGRIRRTTTMMMMMVMMVKTYTIAFKILSGNEMGDRL
jgi:hypothetical protein